MKIVSLELPAGYQGLADLSMRGLKDIVLLAGPNGGGKSRILQAVAHYSRNKLTNEERARNREAIENNQRSISHYEHALAQLRSKGVADHRIGDNERQISAHNQEIENLERALADSDRVLTDPVDRKPVVVEYRVDRLKLKDSGEFKLNDLLASPGSMSSEFNVGLSPEYGLAAIHELMYRYVHEEGAAEKELIGLEVDRLKQLIKDFLDTDFTYDGKSGPMLFGRRIAEAGLSKGQIVLLQIVMSLFFQDGTNDDLLLLLDEPEVHLHPSAVLQLIDRVKKSCPKAQVWIATHSVHILAHFDQDFVWFVKEGAAQKGGSRRLEVLHSLLGDDRGVDELSAFISLPVKSAALSFAAQCLAAPGVADTPSGDPQTSQIREIIGRLRGDGEDVRILDFGMGKGRLLTELQDAFGLDLRSAGIDYVGFDPAASSEDQELCRSRIVESFGSSQGKYFTSIDDLRRLNRQSLSVVVMCNVLHEIMPTDWLQAFGSSGYVTDLIAANGYLLVVEDQLLKVGERAHQFGFLVLSDVELRLLFGCEQQNEEFVTSSHPDPRYSSRLKAHLIPSRFVANATHETVRNAILELKNTAQRAVRRQQGDQFSATAAREYAFWTHQWANASLALDG